MVTQAPATVGCAEIRHSRQVMIWPIYEGTTRMSSWQCPYCAWQGQFRQPWLGNRRSAILACPLHPALVTSALRNTITTCLANSAVKTPHMLRVALPHVATCVVLSFLAKKVLLCILWIAQLPNIQAPHSPHQQGLRCLIYPWLSQPQCKATCKHGTEPCTCRQHRYRKPCVSGCIKCVGCADWGGGGTGGTVGKGDRAWQPYLTGAHVDAGVVTTLLTVSCDMCCDCDCD